MFWWLYLYPFRTRRKPRMALSPNQLVALKASIDADPAFTTEMKASPDGRNAIAAAYNLPAAPDFWAWKAYLTKNDVVSSTSIDGTNWTWVGNGFITRSAGEQETWNQLWNASGAINPSLPQVRQAFADILSGTGNAALNRAHMLAMAREKATRGEKLFATGTGSSASPAVRAVVGQVSFQDVDSALNLA
jgi:hypothetical protein